MGFEGETKNTSTINSECESKPHAYISSAQNGICNGRMHLFSISEISTPNQSLGNVAECHFNDSAVSSLDQCPWHAGQTRMSAIMLARQANEPSLTRWQWECASLHPDCCPTYIRPTTLLQPHRAPPRACAKSVGVGYSSPQC